MTKRYPDTTRAILYCKRCQVPTKHVFLEYRENAVKNAVDLAFVCTQVINRDTAVRCGQVRVWGNEPTIWSMKETRHVSADVD